MSSRLDIPVERHRLDNGLRIVLSPDDTAPVVAVNLWYAVGSRDERPGRTGFAHLFEHMMFQGSAHVPKNRHFELVERAGGSLNASTWFDRTNYFETLPSHHLNLALWLEADRMGWMLPALTQETLDNQRDVVKNEKLQRYDNRPYGDWQERIQTLLFPEDHPYHHTVIGSMDDLDAASLDDVEAFFRTYYRPNNCVLTVCGDLPTDTLERIDRYFGAIPAGDPPPAVPGRTELEPVLGRTERRRVEDDVPLPRTLVACRIPPYTDPRFHAAEVAATVLGTGRASRLYRSLVREQGVAKDVVAFAYPLVTGGSLLLLWATGYPEVEVERLEEAVGQELDAMTRVEPSEVRRAVALTETSLVRELETVAQRADLLSMFTTHFDEPERLNSELDRIEAVTPEALRSFAEERLGPDNRAVVSYVPRSDAALEPDDPVVEAMAGAGGVVEEPA
jgi:predicted Zn-dependent peptidase